MCNSLATPKKRRFRIYGQYVLDEKSAQVGAYDLSADVQAEKFYLFDERTSALGLPEDEMHAFDSIEALAMWLIVANCKDSEIVIGGTSGLSESDREKLQSLLQ